MKNSESIKKEMFEKWLEICNETDGSFIDIDKIYYTDIEYFPRILNLYINKSFSNPEEYHKLYYTDLGIQKIFDFIKSNNSLLGYFLNEDRRKNENTIDVTYSYKGEKFVEFNLSVELLKNSQYFWSLRDSFINILGGYVLGDELAAANDIKRNKDNYRYWANLPDDTLRIKLRIWKDCYPEAYKAAVDSLELLTWEEMEEKRKESIQNE